MQSFLHQRQSVRLENGEVPLWLGHEHSWREVRAMPGMNTVKEEVFVGEKFRTFPSKTFRMELNFVLSNWPKTGKLEKTIERPVNHAEEISVWKLISYIFEFYGSYEIKFPTKISSFTVLRNSLIQGSHTPSHCSHPFPPPSDAHRFDCQKLDRFGQMTIQSEFDFGCLKKRVCHTLCVNIFMLRLSVSGWPGLWQFFNVSATTALPFTFEILPQTFACTGQSNQTFVFIICPLWSTSIKFNPNRTVPHLDACLQYLHCTDEDQ